MAQGTAAIPLLAAGLVLSWLAIPGWIELVLMWPNRVGGIAATCAEAFRPYSPVLANLTGTCYWWGWVPTCGLTALLSASAIGQWYLPGVPVTVLALVIIALMTVVNLCGVRWVSRLAVVIASVSATLALLSGLVPVLAGTVNWRTAASFHLTLPFHGAFGAVTSAMAGLYLIGFAAPAFEAATCHVGETRNPEREVPRAVFASAGLASLYFIALPVIWLGVLGPHALAGDLSTTLGPTFAPLFGAGAKAAALWFLIFNMFHGSLQPLAGASRTLSQLSEDGLLPRSLARRNRYDCPWIATVVTAASAGALLVSGDPPAVIAAANLTYLISICMPSVAVWLLRRHSPTMPRPWRAPRFTIGAGLVAAAIWAVSTLLGFEQFGIKFVLLGLALAYSGSLAYSWRAWQDRRGAGTARVPRSLGMKLTGSMVLVMVLDGAGYLLAVGYVDTGQTELVAVLQDIFVAVALLTVAVGLVLPGMITHAVTQVTAAAHRLQTGTLPDLTRALRALGSGDLAAAAAHPELFQVDVRTKDEVAVMATEFNAMQDEILQAAASLDGAREELRAGRERLEHLASYDPLTGLMNRWRFDLLLNERVAAPDHAGSVGSVTMLDLDNFKMINDSRGHAVGDDVLKLVADVLRAELPVGAVIARLGGDEFAFLLDCVSEQEGLEHSRRVLAALNDHSAAADRGRRVRVAASAGVAVFDGRQKETASQLMMDVDVAMYEAKDAGGNRVALAGPDGAGRHTISTRQDWLDLVREALDGRGFHLYAQPIQSLADGSVTRHELLLRLITADGRILPPGDYLPLAERHGLIREIDRWVVREAFALLRAQLVVEPRSQFEVNLSGLSIGDADLEALITHEMSGGDIPPMAMVFEITETAAIVDIAAAADFAHRIAALGCGWALDDFGAGFSSFLYLKTLPFNYVKIDGSFVLEVANSRQDRQVVHAIVQIARSMGMQTIAEFVESEAILDVLRDLGVDFAQGYFVGRPAPRPLGGPDAAGVPAMVGTGRPTTILAIPPVTAPVTVDVERPDAGAVLSELDRAAVAVGVTDVLVLRRLPGGRLLHIGGLGRGASWAGNVELSAEETVDWPPFPSAETLRWHSPTPVRVLGPYYAAEAVLLAVAADTYVLLGASTGGLSSDIEAFRRVAALAAKNVQGVAAAKALADELEILHAMRAVMHCPNGSVAQAMAHVAQVAAESLSCEVAVVAVAGEEHIAIVQSGWDLSTDEPGLRRGLDAIHAWAPLSGGCEQDSTRSPLPAPFQPENGVASHLVIELAGPVHGLLILLHTRAAARGFTTLCQQVAQAVADAAGPVLNAAQVRNSLHDMVHDAEQASRRDALTGLANRRGWQEALAEANARPGPRWASVALIDLKDLKFINDSRGQVAGDEYLQTAAARLLAGARPGDTVARLGGDEFAVLRCSPQLIDQALFTEQVRAAFADGNPGMAGAQQVRASVGTAQCPPGGDLAAALKRADIAMYLEKSILFAYADSPEKGA